MIKAYARGFEIVGAGNSFEERFLSKETLDDVERLAPANKQAFTQAEVSKIISTVRDDAIRDYRAATSGPSLSEGLLFVGALSFGFIFGSVLTAWEHRK